jgi:hypothetical protein
MLHHSPTRSSASATGQLMPSKLVRSMMEV